MAIQKFEDIIAWQKAQDLVIEIYLRLDQSGIIHSKIKFQEQQFLYQIILLKALTEAATPIFRGSYT